MSIREEIGRYVTKGSSSLQKFSVLFIVGFFMILLGVIILIVAIVLSGNGSMDFGALIFIGPIPIVVGAGPEATWMILFAIILATLTIIMFLIMHKEIARATFRAIS